jgi:hypothetical protein
MMKCKRFERDRTHYFPNGWYVGQFGFKYLREINLKKERFVLAFGFRGFSIWLLGPITFRPMVGEYIMVEGFSKINLLSLW